LNKQLADTEDLVHLFTVGENSPEKTWNNMIAVSRYYEEGAEENT
jgi:hypothetical protein